MFLSIAESNKFAAVSKTFLGLSKTIGGGWWCSPNPEWHLNPTNCSHTDTRSRNQALGEINQLAGSSTNSPQCLNFTKSTVLAISETKLWSKFKRSCINHPELSHMFFQVVLLKWNVFVFVYFVWGGRLLLAWQVKSSEEEWVIITLDLEHLSHPFPCFLPNLPTFCWPSVTDWAIVIVRKFLILMVIIVTTSWFALIMTERLQWEWSRSSIFGW